MTAPADEHARPVEQEWTRSLRGLDEVPGPWHLVKMRSDRSWFGSQLSECGKNPTRRNHTRYDRPTEGKFCRQCERAAEQRLRPGKEAGQ